MKRLVISYSSTKGFSDRYLYTCPSCDNEVNEKDWCKKHQLCFYCGSIEGCCEQWTCGEAE